MGLNKSFLSNSMWGALSSVIASLSRIAVSIILARVFTPDINGNYLLLIWFSEFLSLFIGFGATITLTRFIALEDSRNNPQKIASIIYWVKKRSLLFGIIVSALYWILLSNLDTTKHFSKVTHIISILHLLLYSYSNIMTSILTGLKQFKHISNMNLITGVSFIILQAAGSVMWGLNGAIAAFAINNALTIKLAATYMPKLMHVHAKWNYVDKEITNFAMHSGIAAVISAVVWSRCEVFFLNIYSTPKDVAYFGVSLTISSALAMGVTMMTNALIPHFSGLQSKRFDNERLQADYSLIIKLIAIFSIPLCLLLAGFTPILLPFVFGSDYAEASSIAQTLLFAGFFSFASVGACVQYAAGKSRFIAILNAFTSLMFIVLLFLTVPTMGAYGAAVIRVVIQLLITIVGTVYTAKVIRIDFPIRSILVLSIITLLFWFEVVVVQNYFLLIIYICLILLLLVSTSFFTAQEKTRIFESFEKLLSKKALQSKE